jgi:hypothetical protein
MKQLLISAFFLFTAGYVNAQDNSFEQWDKNYAEINLDELLNLEQDYADSIETNYGDSLQFYFRADKYRFEATFSGNWRAMPYERKSIMSRTFGMIGVDQGIVKNIKNEVEIVTQDGTIWMPIQRQLEKPFKKEVSGNSNVYFYTFFVNHHSTSKGLVNLFLISEFNAERNQDEP